MVSKVAMFGKRPVHFHVAGRPMMTAPAAGQDWRCQFAGVITFPRRH
jgi:hypothetical protein